MCLRDPFLKTTRTIFDSINKLDWEYFCTDRHVSHRRFTYGNLVTTSPSSKWWGVLESWTNQSPNYSPNHSIRWERRAVCTKGRDVISTSWWLALTRNSSFITRRIADYPTFSDKVRNTLNASVQRACSPEHSRAWQTCYCVKLPCVRRTKSLSDAIKQESYLTLFSRLRSLSLTELTRQITQPTKNGHAPPPIESRKSYQPVNPYCVWTWWVFPCWVK